VALGRREPTQDGLNDSERKDSAADLSVTRGKVLPGETLVQLSQAEGTARHSKKKGRPTSSRTVESRSEGKHPMLAETFEICEEYARHKGTK